MTKPILKRSSSSPTSNHHTQHHSTVHFPHSPAALTRTFTTHCPSQYDRSPIVVSTNACAIPERNSREYNNDDDSAGASSSSANARHSPCRSARSGPNIAHDYHPKGIARALQLADSMANIDDQELARAQNRRAGASSSSSSYASFPFRPPPPSISSLPSLVPDLSSESDESDGFASPSPVSASYTGSRHPGKLSHLSLSNPVVVVDPSCDPFNTPTPRAMSILSSPSNLAFLPHPPSPPACSSGIVVMREQYDDETDEFAALDKARRKQRREQRGRVPPYDETEDGYARDMSSMSSGLSISIGNYSTSRTKSPSRISTSPSSPSSALRGSGGGCAKGRERYRRYASAAAFSSGHSGDCLEGF